MNNMNDLATEVCKVTKGGTARDVVKKVLADLCAVVAKRPETVTQVLLKGALKYSKQKD